METKEPITYEGTNMEVFHDVRLGGWILYRRPPMNDNHDGLTDCLPLLPAVDPFYINCG